MEKKHKILIIFAILLTLSIIYLNIEKILFLPTDSNLEPSLTKNDLDSFETIAQNLKIPWEIAFLPSGKILITQRPGNLLIIGENKEEIQIQGVTQNAEGGLLGMTLHPNFQENNFLYLYITNKENGKILNRIERHKLVDNTLTDKKIIIDMIPGAPYHDGGRIIILMKMEIWFLQRSF